jgi:hypothetical protein
VELKAAKPAPGAYAIFPVKPGDRRLFVTTKLSDSSGYSVEEEVDAMISEVWTPGEAEPTITVD